MQSVRIYEIPNCKMVSSGVGMFGQEKFDNFEKWFSSLTGRIFPENFLFWDDKSTETPGMHWIHLYKDGMNVPSEYEIVDFKGGLYAVAADIDQQTDVNAMKIEVDKFLEQTGFERDFERFELGNIITTPLAREIMGYNQMDYYTPIKSSR